MATKLQHPKQSSRLSKKPPTKDSHDKPYVAVFPKELVTTPRLMAWATKLAIGNLALDTDLGMLPRQFRPGSFRFSSSRDLASTVGSYYGADLPEDTIANETQSFLKDLRQALQSERLADWNFLASTQVWGIDLTWCLQNVEDCTVSTEEHLLRLLAGFTNWPISQFSRAKAVTCYQGKAGAYFLKVYVDREKKFYKYVIQVNDERKFLPLSCVSEYDIEIEDR